MIRETAGFEPKEFAEALGLKVNTYQKYETRSLLPHYLIPMVCEITGQPSWKSPGQVPNEPPPAPHRNRG